MMEGCVGDLKNQFYRVVAASILGVCIAYGFGRVANSAIEAVRENRAAQRVVTVRGLAEREVPADLAIWPLTFTETDNDLALLQKRLNTDRRAVAAFLKSNGFTDAELSESAPAISDAFATQYQEAAGRPRYSAQVTVTLRTTRIESMKKSVQRAGELVSQGVVLSGGYGNGSQYFFKGLNEIKPSMIVEATLNARKAAEQFAKDSKSRVGSIRSAQQGLFSIEDRDPYTPEIKRVRVVTTVEYYLIGD
jgi:hypothetical protein